MNKILQVTSYITILLALCLICLFGFWLFYPYEPLTFKGDVFKIVNKKVAQGELLKYVSDYCKYTNSSASVTRSFVNGIVYTTPTVVTSRDCGCHKITIGATVPKELPVGNDYRLEMVYQYKVNPLRTITIKRSSENFSVIESPKNTGLRIRSY